VKDIALLKRKGRKKNIRKRERKSVIRGRKAF
jgi:hypothetical protein